MNLFFAGRVTTFPIEKMLAPSISPIKHKQWHEQIHLVWKNDKAFVAANQPKDKSHNQDYQIYIYLPKDQRLHVTVYYQSLYKGQDLP